MNTEDSMNHLCELSEEELGLVAGGQHVDNTGQTPMKDGL